jgi:ABC-2 type transport system permease protein
MNAPPREAVQPNRPPAARVPSGGSRLAALAALYTLTLRQHLHGKRWLILGALFLTPAVLAGIVRVADPELPTIAVEFLLVFMFIPQALLPLVALLYASGIIQDEQEEQTFTYILIRPISRWAIYVVKLLATLTTTVLLCAVFTALTYAVIYVGAETSGENIPLRCAVAIGVHSLAVTAYCCLFGVISLLTRWTLVLGFLYTALFEGLLANLPFGIRLLTVIYYTRQIAYRSMKFIVTEGGRRENMAADAWQLDILTDPNLLEHPSLVSCVVGLLVGSFVAMVVGAVLCGWREFHVKTPEGS